jgi:hypothetical protein
MTLKFTIVKRIVFFSVLITGVNLTNGQQGDDSLTNRELYQTIARMDSILFNAFNSRDIVKFGSFFTKDLEFFHDKGGLTDYEYTMNFMKDVAKNNNGLTRQLVKGSLEVYPIPGYGAIETGAHTFCHAENGKQDCGTFKFLHVWQKKDGAWKISRVVSYGH